MKELSLSIVIPAFPALKVIAGLYTVGIAVSPRSAVVDVVPRARLDVPAPIVLRTSAAVIPLARAGVLPFVEIAGAAVFVAFAAMLSNFAPSVATSRPSTVPPTAILLGIDAFPALSKINCLYADAVCRFVINLTPPSVKR